MSSPMMARMFGGPLGADALAGVAAGVALAWAVTASLGRAWLAPRPVPAAARAPPALKAVRRGVPTPSNWRHPLSSASGSHGMRTRLLLGSAARGGTAAWRRFNAQTPLLTPRANRSQA